MRAPPESLIPTTGQPDLDGHVHHLADLLGEDLGERAAEDREVLAEDADGPAEDRPVARDDGVAPGPVLAHPELDLAVADEAVELDERARVEQEVDPLAGEQLAAVVLPRDRLLRPRVRRGLAQLTQPGELLLGRLVPGRHRAEPNGSRSGDGEAPRGRLRRPARPRSASRCRAVDRASAETSRQARGNGTRAPAGARAHRPRSAARDRGRRGTGAARAAGSPFPRSRARRADRGDVPQLLLGAERWPATISSPSRPTQMHDTCGEPSRFSVTRCASRPDSTIARALSGSDMSPILRTPREPRSCTAGASVARNGCLARPLRDVAVRGRRARTLLLRARRPPDGGRLRGGARRARRRPRAPLPIGDGGRDDRPADDAAARAGRSRSPRAPTTGTVSSSTTSRPGA